MSRSPELLVCSAARQRPSDVPKTPVISMQLNASGHHVRRDFVPHAPHRPAEETQAGAAQVSRFSHDSGQFGTTDEYLHHRPPADAAEKPCFQPIRQAFDREGGLTFCCGRRIYVKRNLERNGMYGTSIIDSSIFALRDRPHWAAHLPSL